MEPLRFRYLGGTMRLKTAVLPILFLCVAASAQTLPVPPETRLLIQLENGISSKTSREGDRFSARVESPEEYSGATVRGHIASLNESGRLKGKTEMSLAFDDIQPRSGAVAPIRAELTEVRESESVKVVDEEGNIQSGSRGNQTIKRSAIGAAIGGALGGLMGGGKGALLGILLGGGAGAGSLMIEGGKEIRLESGTEMEIRTLRGSQGRELSRSSEGTIDRDVIRDVQTALNDHGYDAGEADGQIGSKTRAAIRRYQTDNGLPVTGRVDRQTAEKLGIRW
jgi:hypothetical protein